MMEDVEGTGTEDLVDQATEGGNNDGHTGFVLGGHRLVLDLEPGDDQDGFQIIDGDGGDAGTEETEGGQFFLSPEDLDAPGTDQGSPWVTARPNGIRHLTQGVLLGVEDPDLRETEMGDYVSLDPETETVVAPTIEMEDVWERGWDQDQARRHQVTILRQTINDLVHGDPDEIEVRVNNGLLTDTLRSNVSLDAEDREELTEYARTMLTSTIGEERAARMLPSLSRVWA